MYNLEKQKQQAIESIIEEFDFEKVLKTMEFLEWSWIGHKKLTLEILINKAYYLLNGVANEKYDNGDCYEFATGGFVARTYCGELSLKFVISSWEEEFCSERQFKINKILQ